MIAIARAALDDVHHALRRIRRSRVPTLTTTLLLTTSIGLACAAYAVLDTLVLRKLPSPNPEQLVVVSGVGADRRLQLTGSLFDHIAERREYASHVFGFGSNLVQGTIGDPTRMLLAFGVTGEYFAALGGSPVVGRYLTPRDDDASAVISYRVWRTSFRMDPAVVGRTLTIGSTPVTIVGVAAPEFRSTNLHANWDVILPRNVLLAALDTPSPADRPMEVGARLKPGVTPALFESQLNAMWPALLEATVPARSTLAAWRQQRGERVQVDSLQHGLNYALQLRPSIQRTAVLTFGLALFIAAAACLTLALMAVVRGVRHERQIGIRFSLGASRARVLREHLVESTFVSAAGCLGGLALALWLSRVGASFLPTTPDVDWDVHISAETVWLAVLVALAATFINGVLPVTVATRGALQGLLQFGAGIARPHVALRTALLLLQLGVSVVLVHYALAFVADLRALARVDAGFPVDNLRVYSLTGRFPRRLLDETYFETLLSRVRAIPGVDSVGFTGTGPLPFLSQQEFGRVFEAGDSHQIHATNICTFPGLVEGIGLPLRTGRDFSWRERNVAVISESTARALFPGGDAVGNVIRAGQSGAQPPAVLQVVGVVGDVAYHGPRVGRRPMVFTPCLDQDDPRPSTFVAMIFARSNRTLADLERDIERETAQLGAQIIYRSSNAADDLASSVQQERMLAAVAGAFAFLIALLTAVGLYAFCSYVAALRSKELAIRAGLGATPVRLSRSLLREIAIVVSAGSVLGVVGTLVLRGVLVSTLGDVVLPATSHVILGVVGVAAVAATATLIPVWRALKLDVAAALRSE